MASSTTGKALRGSGRFVGDQIVKGGAVVVAATVAMKLVSAMWRVVVGNVFGTAPAAYAEALVVPEGVTSSPEPTVPRASTVARMGAEMLARGETAEAHDLAPNYLREWTSPSKGKK